MITAAVIVGLGAFWLWAAVNMPGPFSPVKAGLERIHPKLPSCPFCLGAWLALALTLGLVWADFLVWREFAFVWLAGAGITGFLGSWQVSD